MSKQPLPSRILVLGATSAIAIAVLRPLAEAGGRFYLVARNADKLTAVAADLSTRGAASVDTCVLDLDDTSAHIPMLEAAVAALGEIDCAFFAHGVLGDQLEAEKDFEVAAQILHTNFISVVSLLTWLGNYFAANGRGTLAVISSVAGDRGRKSNYVYGTSKAALNVFLDGMRNRLDRLGVHVLTIKPGFVATPMTAHIPRGPLFATPQKVAVGILAALQSRKDVVYVPGFWAIIMFIIRSIPEWKFKSMDL